MACLAGQAGTERGDLDPEFLKAGSSRPGLQKFRAEREIMRGDAEGQVFPA